MAAEKKCSKCGKKLRADNTKGYCGASAACARRVAGGAGPADAGDDQVLERVGAAKPAPKSDAQKRFRVVADALGYDPEQLLNGYCEGWLALVKASAEKVESGGG